MSVLEPGAVFGRDFRIVKALRAGGMGAVYIAEQMSTGKQRALKVMAPELAGDQGLRERFVLEAMAASKIDSDHVVEIVTAGVDEQTRAPYIVMELLKGEELADALTRTGALPLGDVAEILAQVGHALEQAHAHGIVHRDLKPENVFLATSRRRDVAFTAKILDFGIAKLVADSQKTGTQPLGTPLFMAPEQTDRRGRICPATDVWALGLIAFKLLVGRDFWAEADGSLPMLLREICVEPIPFASARAREFGAEQRIPPGFDAWFSRCVTRDVDARFQEAGEAVRAFAELVTADAPRGVLVMQAASMSGDISPMALTPMPRSLQVTPSGSTRPPAREEAALVNARTAATPGAATLESPTPKKGAPVALILGGMLVLGGAAAFFALRGGGGDATKGAPTAAPSASTAAMTPTASASAAAPAGAAKTTCPGGMVLIPGGNMFMGARDLPDGADAKPPHAVSVTSFCVDKTEVTTKAYFACVDQGDCERPLEQVSWPNIKDESKKRYSPFCNANHRAEHGDHPINCVAWPMADNYCKKNKKRLPTEAEWEFAARGSKQNKYPWGDDAPTAKHLNACGAECAKWGEANGDAKKTMYEGDDGFVGTAPVGSFPKGASAHGVLDLAGNVWEWTSDFYAPYTDQKQVDPEGPATGDKRVLRGGDFFGFDPNWASPAWRWKTDPETYNHAIGFRCVADPT
ncbi:MAG TPA: bifunctional serine/threonine-protein kinase/formylglycine-generating enzyme family protein [Byssovorax sp.]